MKQFATILFFGLVLFNLGGYRVLSGYLHRQVNQEWEACLDRQQYDESDLISIKTPLNLPYYASSPAFERVSGELLVKGVVYRYVKRRVYNDTLEVLCIRDSKGTRLRAATNQYGSGNETVVAHGKRSLPAPIARPLFFEYCNSISEYGFTTACLPVHHRAFYISLPIEQTTSRPEQPPEMPAGLFS